MTKEDADMEDLVAMLSSPKPPYRVKPTYTVSFSILDAEGNKVASLSCEGEAYKLVKAFNALAPQEERTL